MAKTNEPQLSKKKTEPTQPPRPDPELLHLARSLKQALDASGIQRGTSRARLFEVAFIMGSNTERAIQKIENPRGYPEVCLISGQSLLDIL